MLSVDKIRHYQSMFRFALISKLYKNRYRTMVLEQSTLLAFMIRPSYWRQYSILIGWLVAYLRCGDHRGAINVARINEGERGRRTNSFRFIVEDAIGKWSRNFRRLLMNALKITRLILSQSVNKKSRKYVNNKKFNI